LISALQHFSELSTVPWVCRRYFLMEQNAGRAASDAEPPCAKGSPGSRFLLRTILWRPTVCTTALRRRKGLLLEGQKLMQPTGGAFRTCSLSRATKSVGRCTGYGVRPVGALCSSKSHYCWRYLRESGDPVTRSRNSNFSPN